MADKPEVNDGVDGANQETENPDKPAKPEVDYKAKFEELDANYKQSQRNLTNLQTKLGEAQRQGADNTAIKAELAEMRRENAFTKDYMDFVVKNVGETNPAYGEQPQQRGAIPTPTLDAYNVERAEQVKKDAEAKQIQDDANDFSDNLVAAKLDWNDPEIKAHFTKFGTAKEASKQIIPYVNQRNAALETEKKKQKEQAIKDKEREDAESDGTLVTSRSNSSSKTSGIPTKRAEFAAYVRNLTPKQYAEQKDEINALMGGDNIN